MAARLTRARKRLAGERFELPEGPALDERVGLAADIAYLAFTAGYAPASGPGRRCAPTWPARRSGWSGCSASSARRTPSSTPCWRWCCSSTPAATPAPATTASSVLLADQDRSRWHADEITEAIGLLRPLTDAPAAPYLLQALIAAEHAIAATAADTDWPRIAAATASSRS